MSNDQPVQSPAPPVSEEIHLPGPSAIPLLTGISTTLVVVGLGLSLWISVVGAIGLVLCILRWVGDTRSDIAELPEGHTAD